MLSHQEHLFFGCLKRCARALLANQDNCCSLTFLEQCWPSASPPIRLRPTNVPAIYLTPNIDLSKMWTLENQFRQRIDWSYIETEKPEYRVLTPIPTRQPELQKQAGLCHPAQHLFVGCSGGVNPKNGSQPHFSPRLTCHTQEL